MQPLAPLLPPIPRLAPSRLHELSALLASLQAASQRVSRSNPPLARAYQLQRAAVLREQASWRAALSAVRLRAAVAVAVAVLLLAEAAFCSVDAPPALRSTAAAAAAALAAAFAAAAVNAAGGRVEPWQREYAEMANVGKARRRVAG